MAEQDRDPDPRLGKVLADRYRIDHLLGEGGMGKVYAAEHVLMRKRLALKILHKELSNVPEIVARFEREARAAANIEHANIAAATDFGKLPDGAVYLALEFVEGTSLRDVIARDAPLGAMRALKIAKQIASALASAHALDIVHRDLKPENVMLVRKGGDRDFVKVLDFGIAKVPIGQTAEEGDQPITKMQMVLGTPEYMAPEQALSETVDGRSDVYALGVMLYEMLAGIRPFRKKPEKGILAQQLAAAPPAFAQTAPYAHVPPQVESMVLELLQVKRQGRPQAIEVAHRIDSLLVQPLDQSGRMFTQIGGTITAGAAAAEGGSHPDLPGGIAQRSNLRPGSASDATRGPLGSSPGSMPDLGALADGALPPWPGSAPDGVLTDLGAVNRDAQPNEPGDAERIVRPPADAGVDAEAGASRTADRSPARAGLIPGIGRPWPQLLVQLLSWIDAQRPHLPAPLRKIPGPTLLAGAVAALAAVVLAVGLLVGSSAPRDAPAVASASSASLAAGSVAAPATGSAAGPTEAEVAKARQQGSAALETLARRHPSNARLQLELARAYRLERSYEKTVAALGKTLALDPTLNEHKDVATLLWDTAQRSQSISAAFELLQGPMGSKGADIIYDLVTEPKVRTMVKKRATKYLKSDRFQRQASQALRVAVALRHARSCTAAYALLPEAERAGDGRCLTYLRRYESTRGCGRRRRNDCFPCMRRDARLRNAISAIEKRIKG